MKTFIYCMHVLLKRWILKLYEFTYFNKCLYNLENINVCSFKWLNILLKMSQVTSGMIFIFISISCSWDNLLLFIVFNIFNISKTTLIL